MVTTAIDRARKSQIMNQQLSLQQWQRAQQIFEQIIDAPEQQVEDLLIQHCQDDDELLFAVKQLLDQDQALQTFFTQDTNKTLKQLLNEHELVADMGRYRLIKKLGEGGMGQVYLAERSDEEFHKQVVIKLIRHEHIMNEYSTTQFRKERQTLAGLEHPNIAQLLDGGTLENNTPYVVMQYVEGVPITDFCQSNQLNTEDRIRLFVKLCHAVAYAHQKMIIHRDIKPANVLVKATGEPQLLDFGIAQSAETHNKMDTMLSISGTPGYASPEQLMGRPQFASSDVYSLGVLLYQLIFETRPFNHTDQEDLIKAMQKGVDFAHPSTHIKSLSKKNKSQEKELHAILNKALSFENINRYQSCQSLIQDLECLLNLRPVSVYSVSQLYRLRKFSQRNQLSIFLSVCLILALLTFSFSTWFQSLRLKAQRDYAISQQNKAQALSDILLSAYQDADPTHTRGEQVSAREILDQSLRHINQKLQKQDISRIELKSTLSTVYNNLGLYKKATKIAQQAVDEAQNHANIDDQTVLSITLNLAMILSESGAKATTILNMVNPLMSDLALTHTDRQALRWKAMKLKATALTQLAKSQDAIVIYRQILDEKRSFLDANSLSINESIYDLAYTTYYDGYGDVNADILQQAYDTISQRDDASHHLRTKVTNVMANILIEQNQLEQAEQLYQHLYQQTLKIFGDDHPTMGPVINKLAEIAYRQGHIEQSIEYFQRYVSLSEQFFGPNHINVAFATFNLANVYESGAQDFEKAATLYQKAIDIGHQVYPNKHKNLGYFYRSLGTLYLNHNQPEVAKPFLQESLANYLHSNAPKGRNIAKGRLLMAQVYDQLSVNGLTKKYLDLALPILEENYSPENVYVQQARALQQKLDE